MIGQGISEQPISGSPVGGTPPPPVSNNGRYLVGLAPAVALPVLALGALFHPSPAASEPLNPSWAEMVAPFVEGQRSSVFKPGELPAAAPADNGRFLQAQPASTQPPPASALFKPAGVEPPPEFLGKFLFAAAHLPAPVRSVLLRPAEAPPPVVADFRGAFLFTAASPVPGQDSLFRRPQEPGIEPPPVVVEDPTKERTLVKVGKAKPRRKSIREEEEELLTSVMRTPAPAPMVPAVEGQPPPVDSLALAKAISSRVKRAEPLPLLVPEEAGNDDDDDLLLLSF